MATGTVTLLGREMWKFHACDDDNDMEYNFDKFDSV